MEEGRLTLLIEQIWFSPPIPTPERHEQVKRLAFCPMTRSSTIRNRKVARPAIYIAFGIVALLLLAATAIRFFFPSETAKAMIVADLSKRLGHQVSIESVSIGFYPDAEIVAGNVSVTDNETSTKLVSIRKVRIDLNLWQMFKGNYIIEKISMNSPSISVTRSIDGSWMLPGMILASTPKKEEPEKRTESVSAEIGNIRIRSGNLRLQDEASGFVAVVRNIDGTVDPRNDEIILNSAIREMTKLF
jgi:uncharacterized protein involved in outer membrane biogenesis